MALVECACTLASNTFTDNVVTDNGGGIGTSTTGTGGGALYNSQTGSSYIVRVSRCTFRVSRHVPCPMSPRLKVWLMD